MKFTASQIAEFVSGIVEGDKGVKIDKLSKDLVPHVELSRSKVIEIIVNEKLSNFYKSKEI